MKQNVSVKEMNSASYEVISSEFNVPQAEFT